MKTILAVVLMSFAAQASFTPAPTPVASCSATPAVKKVVKKKKVAKKIAKKPSNIEAAPLMVFFAPEPIIVDRVVTKTVTKTVVEKAPTPDVVVSSPEPTTWTVTGGKANVVWHKLTSQEDVVWMGHAAAGFGAVNQQSSGLLGLRVKVPAASLGVEAYTAFDYGLGAMALVYPYQGDILSWHLNAGALGWKGAQLNTTDLSRSWDLTVGTGIEVKLMKHLALTLDYRAGIPSPLFISEHSTLDADGRYLDVKHVLGNSFAEGTFLLGLLLY